MSLSGVNICVSSVFESLARAEVLERLENLGAVLVDDVGAETDVMVSGGFGQTKRTKAQRKRDSSNQRKAAEQGIPVWGEYALVARLLRSPESQHVLGWVPGPATFEDGRSLRQVRVVEARGSDGFDPELLQCLIDFVRARITVTPGDLEDALASWGDRAPYRSAEGVHADNICHPFTVALLCAGDAVGHYELRDFELEGKPFRRMVHIPASNSESFVFSPGGDLVWEVSELAPDHTVEALGICALAQLGGPGDSLGELVDDAIIGPWEYGWDKFLPPEE